ncbi:MAG: AMP-binding protein, partial [Undibacterium sp.]|nr:AMP-binding protein [Undibacterium sp.]
MSKFLEFLKFCGEQSIHFSLVEEQVKVHAPKGRLSPDMVVQLRQYKTELLEWLRVNRDEVVRASVETISICDRDQPLLLSHGQEGLWLSSAMQSTGDAYHFVRVLELNGELDVVALQSSFSLIVERHEALRTVFYQEQGHLFQRILPAEQIELEMKDGLEAEQVEIAQQAFAAAGFDLSKDVMLRLQLIRLSERQHQLTIVLHHIASDGWSLGILVSEFQELYRSIVENRESHLAPLAIQYADYAQWTRSPAHETQLLKSSAYWQAELVGVPELHDIHTDHPRSQQQSFQRCSFQTKLDAQTLAGLTQLTQASGATMFMALETLFATLVLRYSQTSDIVIGTPVAGRQDEDIGGLIGYFVNMLPLRHRQDQNLPFTALLLSAKQEILAAFEHQVFPFDRLVREQVKTRSSSYSPLVQISFSLQNNAIAELSLPGIQCRLLQIQKSHTQFDIELSVTETELGLDLEWAYASDLFEQSTMMRMANHFEQLLQAVIRQPEWAMHKHDILSTQERNQLLTTWNNTATSYPQEKCVHQLFEQQVDLNPDGLALIFEDQQISYQELNQKANQLAHYLRQEKTISPDTLVGICLERSIDMVVSMLAVL